MTLITCFDKMARMHLRSLTQAIENCFTKAISNANSDTDANTVLLLISHILFICLLLFSNNFDFSGKFFSFVVVPISLAPLNLTWRIIGGFKVFRFSGLSLANPLKTISSNCLEISLPLYLYIFFVSICTWLNPSPDWVWLKLSTYFFFSTLLFFLITCRLAFEIKNFNQYFCVVMPGLVATNAVINLYNYYFKLSNPADLSQINDFRFAGDFGVCVFNNSNPTCLFYALYLLLTYIYMAPSKASFYKIYINFVRFILFAAVALSQSRGVTLALVISLIYAWWIQSNYLNLKIISFLLLLIAIAIMLSFQFNFTFIVSKFTAGTGLRDEIWINYLKLIYDRPVFGIGERLTVALSLSNGEIVKLPHNLFLAGFIYGGLFGGLGLIIFFYSCVRHSMNCQNPEFIKLSRCIVIYFTISGFFDFEINVLNVNWQWTTYWIIFSMLASCPAQKNYIYK